MELGLGDPVARLRRQVWGRLRRNPHRRRQSGRFDCSIILMAVFYPMVSPYSLQVHQTGDYKQPRPSARHWLGTDDWRL